MSWEYNNYIQTHRENVAKAYDWLVEHGIIKYDVTIRPCIVLYHDESKFYEEEYNAYDEYFYGNRSYEVCNAFDYAWLSHIHNNPHHWQHWVLIGDEDGVKALDMPLRYIQEMICDWMSFSIAKNDISEVLTWYDSHKDFMILSEQTKKEVESILHEIDMVIKNEKNRGEDI